MSDLLILADYDNIPTTMRRLGVDYLLQRLTTGVCQVCPDAISRVRARLYGGWYEGSKKTRVAQELATEVDSKFPAAIASGIAGHLSRIPVQVELAYALEAAPALDLLSTFRRRDRQDNVGCHDPCRKGCQTHPCEMAGFFTIISTGICPRAGCGLTTKDLLYKDQQKLVDTMLAADLLHAARGTANVAIVSSDDDLWPPIMAATLYGSRIFHVQTRHGRRTASYYTRGAGPRYTQLDL